MTCACFCLLPALRAMRPTGQVPDTPHRDEARTNKPMESSRRQKSAPYKIESKRQMVADFLAGKEVFEQKWPRVSMKIFQKFVADVEEHEQKAAPLRAKDEGLHNFRSRIEACAEEKDQEEVYLIAQISQVAMLVETLCSEDEEDDFDSTALLFTSPERPGQSLTEKATAAAKVCPTRTLKALDGIIARWEPNELTAYACRCLNSIRARLIQDVVVGAIVSDRVDVLVESFVSSDSEEEEEEGDSDDEDEEL